MTTLEILIPTYGRPASVSIAIESCIASQDSRISVRCNSNGYEPSLEKYKNYDKRVTYSCFDSNKGPHANFLYLLQHTQARYCMLLSDEDRIELSGVKQFLDYLDSCPESIKVISCSIYDIQNNSYYFQHDVRFTQTDYDLNSFLALSIIPTYMSGLVFSVAHLSGIKLFDILRSSIGNAYPHLDIAKYLLIDGLLRIYRPKVVLKGQDITEGGDGYSHRKSGQTKNNSNFDLNPLVYGPKARARQFYYSNKILNDVRRYMNIYSFLMAKIGLFCFFYSMVLHSDKTTVIKQNNTIRKEVKLGLQEAIESREYAEYSIFSYTFCPLVQMPDLFRILFLKIIVKVRGLLGRIKILSKSKKYA